MPRAEPRARGSGQNILLQPTSKLSALLDLQLILTFDLAIKRPWTIIEA